MVAKGFSLNLSHCWKPAFFSFPERKCLILAVFIFARQSVDYHLFYLLKYSVMEMVVSLSFIFCSNITHIY